jgi:hypothetical protein
MNAASEINRDDQSPFLPPLLLAVMAIAAAGGGLYLLEAASVSSRALKTNLSGGILLLIVSLAAIAVLLGGRAFGPRAEGPLDLSARIGLGFLGGLLGALTSAATQWGLGLIQIPILFGVAMTGELSNWGAILHVTGGAVWGTLFGVLMPLVPGRTIPSRGAMFSLVPTLYVLLFTFPFEQDVGWFGVGLGVLTFVFVALYNLIWGVVTAGVLAWGERTSLAPVSRALGESTVDA